MIPKKCVTIYLKKVAADKPHYKGEYENEETGCKANAYVGPEGSCERSRCRKPERPFRAESAECSGEEGRSEILNQKD